MRSLRSVGAGAPLCRRTPIWIAVLALLMALPVLVACEAFVVPDPQPPFESEASTQATATPTIDDSPTEPADAGDAEESRPADESEGLGSEGRVDIALTDFKITPNEFTVKAGEVTFAFENKGRYTHDFRVEGQGVYEKGPMIGTGRSREWSTTLEPGTYRIFCRIGDHDQLGMVGTMVVVE